LQRRAKGEGEFVDHSGEKTFRPRREGKKRRGGERKKHTDVGEKREKGVTHNSRGGISKKSSSRYFSSVYMKKKREGGD